MPHPDRSLPSPASSPFGPTPNQTLTSSNGTRRIRTCTGSADGSDCRKGPANHDRSSRGEGRHHHRREHRARAGDGRRCSCVRVRGCCCGAARGAGAGGGRRRGRGRDRDACRRHQRRRRRRHGRPRGRGVRPRRHHVQQRRRARHRQVGVGADARELERDHRHRRHRGDAVHARGAEPVDARAQVGGDPELLVDRRLQRHRAQDALRHGQGVAARVHQSGRARSGAARHPLQLRRARQHRHRAVAELGPPHGGRAGRRLRRAARAHAPGQSRCATISSVEDVANLALFLASDESRTITGQSIPVDAGGYMQG